MNTHIQCPNFENKTGGPTGNQVAIFWLSTKIFGRPLQQSEAKVWPIKWSDSSQ